MERINTIRWLCLYLTYASLTPPFCFENHVRKCSLIVSSETVTWLNFTSQILPLCCTLHLLKVHFLWRGGGVGGGGFRSRPPLFEFSGSAPGLNGKVIFRKICSEFLDYLQRYSSLSVIDGTSAIIVSLPFAQILFPVPFLTERTRRNATKINGKRGR